ncbi:hypothetical protein ACFL1G_09580 [Planctomycetota bacterium]
MFYVFALAALYILGLWWCYEVIRRFREDVQEICELKEITRTVAIIFVWFLTVIITILLITYGSEIIKQSASFIRVLL